jgi:hypothetical protein
MSGQDGRLQNKLSCGFQRGFAAKAAVHADNAILVSIWIRGSQRPLRQSEYELRILDGFGLSCPRGPPQVKLKERKFKKRNARYSFDELISSKNRKHLTSLTTPIG